MYLRFAWGLFATLPQNVGRLAPKYLKDYFNNKQFMYINLSYFSIINHRMHVPKKGEKHGKSTIITVSTILV